MTGAWNIVGVLALGALGWFGTSFVGRPLAKYDWVAPARVRACARYGVLVVGEEMKQRCYPSHR